MYKFIISAISLGALISQCSAQSGQCSTEQPVVNAPHKNVWQALSAEEFVAIATTVNQQLNLTSVPTGSGAENYITSIDLLHPNKTDVLPFLSNRGSEPERYARATVQYQSPTEPYNQEYIVGPLPATNATSVLPLSFPFNNDNGGGRSGVASILAAGQGLSAFIGQVGNDTADITRFLWNATLLDNSVALRTGAILKQKDGRQVTWATFLGTPTEGFDSVSVLPLGVFVQVDVTGRDWKEWKITGWYSRGKFYDSTEDFRAAVFAPGFQKPPPNVDGPWAGTARQGDPLPMDEMPPPTPVSQGSRRFSVDAKEDFVTWMDFSFYISTSADTGVALFDVRYKGQRILYELGLEEALAHYAGSDPVQSETLYFDTQGGMGTALVPLVKGYDCPSYATYLNATWSKDSAVTVPDAICLFESDATYPLRRHSSAAYTTVTKNILFTLRTISTVANYDYLIEYNFFLDGSIEVSVRASGYISAAYYDGNEDYGFHIHDALSGSMHDHVLTFKADLDIYGEKNSVQKVEFVPAKVEYPWSGGESRNTMKVAKSFITNEQNSSLNWAPNDAVIYAIVNKDSPNKFGEAPGYRVKRSSGATHLTTQDSPLAGKAANFANHHLYVTQQKDSEPRAADRNNGYDIEDPLVDFCKFLDGDSLDQEDLVLWFNLGMHHVPHTGDLPNTMMTSAHSSMRLEPFNYLLGDPSVATSQQVRIEKESGAVERYGAKSANCSVDLGKMWGL